DAEGNIYVTDVIRGRLQKFDNSGALVASVGQLADSPGNFVRPKHLSVDREGVVYVVDAAFQNVQMFTTDGDLLMYFGSPGPHPGSMSLPAGVAVYDGDLSMFEQYIHPAFEARRLILVSNQFGANKVSVYALGNLRQGRTVADIAPYAVDVDEGLRGEEEVSEDLLQQPAGAAAEQPGTP
ncbi:MAG: NHL repeat-containing protein, partial [Planctomycetota bacterium]